MQSNTYSVAGISAYQGSNDPQPTISGISRLSGSFTAVNGLLQGDHKSPTPYSFNRREEECFYATRTLTLRSNGKYTRYWGNNKQHNSNGVLLAEPDRDFTGSGVMRDRALVKIYEQLRGNSEVIVDLLESAATIKMLRASVAVTSGVGKVLDLIAMDVKKARKRRIAITADWITGKWLEYRYGWMPLIYSMYDAFENLANAEAADVKEIEATSRNEFLKEWSETLPLSSTYGNYRAHTRHYGSERIRLVYKFDLKDRNQLSDWTSLNPATIAWELLPLSFVADWFISIGDSLRNLENWWLWHNKFLGGYETYTTKASIYREVPLQTKLFTSGSTAWAAGYNAETVSGGRSIRTISKSRAVVTSLPAPRGPRFRVRMGAKQVLDSGALLHTLVTGRVAKLLRAL